MGCMREVAAATMSGPLITWIGRLSAQASISCSRVTTQQEKSRAVLSTEERAVRNRVLVIRRTMPWMRLLTTASATGSKRSPSGRSAGDEVGTSPPLADGAGAVLGADD